LISALANIAETPSALGPQDLVIVAVKGPSLASVAASVGPLLGPDTAVLTAMNGVPWWFFHGFGTAYRDLRLSSVDPKGEIESALPARRIVGCVVHASCSTPEPGLVQHHGGQRLIIGEPAGDPAPRTHAIAAQLTAAGFDVEVSRCIQRDIWYKLWGNMTMNPISALTGATMDRILDDELVKRFCLAAMSEAAAIGARIGCPIEQSGEDRIAVTRRLGAVKTSMLQDVEAHRQVEIDVLLSAVREIGERVEVATPAIDALLGLARLQARVQGLYPS
jgi:2-dehydropantoate 2-reductase